MAAKVLSPDKKDPRGSRPIHYRFRWFWRTATIAEFQKPSLPKWFSNQHDVVGRYYIDHSLILNGYFNVSNDMYDKLKFYDMRDINGVSGDWQYWSLPRHQPRTRSAKCGSDVIPETGLAKLQCIQKLAGICMGSQNAKPMEHTLENTKNVLLGMPYLMYIAYQKYFNGMLLMPGLATGGWSKLSQDNFNKRYQIVELMSLTEQRAKSTNRVTLSNEVDSLGMPRVNVHMDWDETDKDSILAYRKNALSKPCNKKVSGNSIPTTIMPVAN